MDKLTCKRAAARSGRPSAHPEVRKLMSVRYGATVKPLEAER